MTLLASKGTTQFEPVRIARIGKKENTAMLATNQQSTQQRSGSENRSQHQIILQDQSRNALVVTVPVLDELKLLLDPDCKKPKTSLNMKTVG